MSKYIKFASLEAFNRLEVEVRASMLVNALALPLSAEGKQLGAVLLRRLLSSEFNDLEKKLSPEAMEAFKAQILLAVQVPNQSYDLRKKVCDIAAELAKKLTDENKNMTWPQLHQFLLAAANSSIPALQISALRMFAIVPGIFGNKEPQYLDLIKQILQKSLLQIQAYEVRKQAVRAVAAFVTFHFEDTELQEYFAAMLPAMIEVIVESIQKHEDDSLLKCLIELSEATPKYLQSQLQNIMGLCLKAMQTENMDEKFTQLALEVTVTLAETAPAMVQKLPANIVVGLVFQILQMMTILEEEEDWSQQDTTEEDDASSPNAVAEPALERLASALGGNTISPQILSNIANMLANPNWKYRHAALMAISAVCKGCHKQMEAMLPQIMGGVLDFLQDPHPRVRYAACNAVGQLSFEFAPIFQMKFHEDVIPGLLMVLDDHANPRTQAHAGAAMAKFFEFGHKEILKKYLEPILTKLESLLISKLKVVDGRKIVLEQVVMTIGAVSGSVEQRFVPYYDRFMPSLKYIVENAVADEYKLLRGKTIECLSLIGLAVGPEKFSRDASEVMDVLLKAHYCQELTDDDPQIFCLISAWPRICKILGKTFQQYLPLVMGPVMKAASMRPDDIEDIDSDNVWHFRRQQKDCGIKKENACRMLVCYARDLKEGFADYVEEVLQLMIPLLQFYFHDQVRVAAAKSLPYLLESGKAKGPQFLESMWTSICKELMAAINSEPKRDVVSEFLLSLTYCIETLGAGCFNEESMPELIKILNNTLVGRFSRAVERGDKRKDKDYDEVLASSFQLLLQLEDKENDEDGDVIHEVYYVLLSLISTHRTSFLPYFNQIVHHFVKLLSPDRPRTDIQFALSVFAEIIEISGPDCVKYTDFFLPAVIQFSQDRDAEVRKAAVYGCGVLAQFGGDAVAQVCAEALPHLMSVIMAPEARTEENKMTTESAINAVTKILKYNNSAINCAEVIPIWLSWLPVSEDDVAVSHVYGYLCDLIEANYPAVIGQNGANIPSIMAIFAEAFCQGAFESGDETWLRVLAIIRQIQTNEEMFNYCVVQLNDDQERALHFALMDT